MSLNEHIGDFETFPDDELEALSQSQSQASSQESEYDPAEDSDQFSQDEDIQSCLGDDEETTGCLDGHRVIVNMTSLTSLLRICRRPNCGSIVEKENIRVVKKGAMLRVHTLCNNSHTDTWDSSPSVGHGKSSMAEINILLAVYVLLTGLHVKQIEDYFAHLKILCFGNSFYYNLQKSVMLKVVWMTWLLSQKEEVEKAKAREREGVLVNCSGDGQFDSPGFTAAYCTYTVQDLYSNAVIGLYVAHKHQVSSSAEMEPFCCKTLLLNLACEHDLKISSFTTDRSSSVKTVLSELSEELPPDYPTIRHFFDVWHFIKAILKDLFKASKLKSCSGLSDWIPSITNQLWYCFSSSLGNPVKLREMILAIPEHISNVHNFPSNTHHKSCDHLPVTGERSKAWLDSNSMEIQKIRSALLGKDNGRVNDLPHMVGFSHTGSIECWNSLHNHYASKNYFYSHESMFARGALTAIDSNSNLHRNQARGEKGALRYALVSNRAGTKWFVRPKMEDKDSSWREAIAEMVLKCMEYRKRPKVDIPIAGPEHLIRGKKVARPDLLEAVTKHQTRMAKNTGQ